MKRWMMVAVAAMGVAAMMSLQACAGKNAWAESEKEEAPEIKVKMEECPKAVQETLKKEAAGGTIAQVDKESEDGKTTYETDVVIGGKNYEIKVAEDGSLISKKLDEGKEDEEKKDEKGSKGKHEKGEHED